MRGNKLTPGSNMKWESSRMMLPEHFEMLNNLKDDEDKSQKTQIESYQWDEIEENIYKAAKSREAIFIKTDNKNANSVIYGVIEEVNSENKKITINTYDKGIVSVNVEKITDAEIAF